MKQKLTLLAVIVLPLLGLWLLQLAITLPLRQYLSWLSWLPVQVEAQSPDPDGCPLCPDCSDTCDFTVHDDLCGVYHICNTTVCSRTCLSLDSDTKREDDDVASPPDDVDPAGREDAYDPNTFTEACAACSLRIRFDVPDGAVSKPVELRAYHTGLPANVPAPKKGVIGCPFFFGAWVNGEGKTVEKFNEPVVIKVADDKAAISAHLKEMAIPAPPENPLPPKGATGSDGSTASTAEKNQQLHLDVAGTAPQENQVPPGETNGSDGKPAGIAPQGNQFVPNETNESDGNTVGTAPPGNQVPPNGTTGSDGQPAGIASQGNQLPPNEITGSDSQPAGTTPAENQVHLSMYDPATKAWVKLCSRTDGQQVAAALVFPTPLEEGGNALFALTLDDTPALDQAADQQGKTTLSMPGSNFRFEILPGTVEVGTYFETTYLSNVPSGGSYRLLPTPIDVKACQADYTTANQIRQLTKFSKPLEITFGFDAKTLARAGGKGNLTLVGLNHGQWADLEEFNARVVRGDNTITVGSSDLGTFSLAVR